MRSGDPDGGIVGFLKRFGAKAGIIAVGAAIAVGTLQQTRFLPKPKIVAHPFSDALSGRATGSDSSSKLWSTLGANVEHDRIAFWMNRLTTTMRGGVENTLGKKSRYDDMIAAKLEERHMPADLVYLAMIESEFNPNATSRVKAKGLWQFMSATARQFGLVVRGKTDERTDPAKATDAALTYLNDLHTRFGSWYLAAAAYNSGGGTVSKALREVLGKTTGTDEDFFRILPNLPKETQDYVPKLIATARVGNDPTRYGLTVKGADGTVAALTPTPVPLLLDSNRVTPSTGDSATKTGAKGAKKSGAGKRSTTGATRASRRGATSGRVAARATAVKRRSTGAKTTIKKPATRKPARKPAAKR